MEKTNTVCALKKTVCRLYCLSMSLASIIFTCLCVLTRLIAASLSLKLVSRSKYYIGIVCSETCTVNLIIVIYVL